MTFDEVLVLENRLTQKFLLSNDFHEGSRASKFEMRNFHPGLVLVDKDRTPKWKPSTLEEVTKDMVDWYFNPLDDPEHEWNPKTQS